MARHDENLARLIASWKAANRTKVNSENEWKLLGMSSKATMFRRRSNPDEYTLAELRTIFKVTKADEETILRIMK